MTIQDNNGEESNQQNPIKYFEERKDSYDRDDTLFYKKEKSIGFIKNQMKNNNDEVYFLQGKNEKTEYQNTSRQQSLGEGAVGLLFTKNFFDEESDASKHHDLIRPVLRNGGEDSNEPTGRRIDKFSSPSHYNMSSPHTKFRNNLIKKTQPDEIQLQYGDDFNRNLFDIDEEPLSSQQPNKGVKPLQWNEDLLTKQQQ